MGSPIDVGTLLRLQQLLQQKNTPQDSTTQDVTPQVPNYTPISGALNYNPADFSQTTTGQQAPVDLSQVAGSRTYRPPEQQPQIQPLQVPYPSPQVPGTSDVQQSAADYAKVLQGQPFSSQYKPSRIREALLAPLMIKQFLRNPAVASQNFQYLTRPGYLGAVQNFSQHLDAAQRQYGVQQQIAKDRLENFRAMLGANKDASDIWQKEFEVGVKGPLQLQELQSIIHKNQVEAEVAGRIKPDFGNPYLLQMPNGDMTPVFPQGRRGGGFDFLGQDGQPVTGWTSFRRIDDKLDPLNDYIQMARDRARTEGRTFTDTDFTKAVGDYREAFNKSNQDAALTRFFAAQQAMDAREGRRAEARDITTAIANDRKEIDKSMEPVTAELQRIQTLRGLLKAGDTDGFAREVAIAASEGAIVGGGHALFRYNMGVVNSLIKGAGPWESMKGRLQSWFVPGKGRISDKIMQQIDNTFNDTEKVLLKQQAAGAKATQGLGDIHEMSPNARDQRRKVMTDYNMESNGLTPEIIELQKRLDAAKAQ